VVEDLVPFLPAHRTAGVGGEHSVGAVSAAPLGNAAVLPISWMYCRMMGADGLRSATEVAILSGQLRRGAPGRHYDGALQRRRRGPARAAAWRTSASSTCARCRRTTGVSAEDVAKRLIDYGFHAPTLSFPVAGTLMVEPTESEPLVELDRFCDAMIAIRARSPRSSRHLAEGRQPAEARAAHRRVAAGGRLAAPLHAAKQAAYPVPGLRRRSTGRRWAGSTTSGRPQPVLQLPAAGRLRRPA
jgi:glycine dehydrogenase